MNSTRYASVIGITAVAALAGFLFGYDSAVINGATEAIKERFTIGPGPLGFAVASALIGAAVGAFVAGSISDRIGRIPVMKIAAVLFFVAAIGSGLAPNIEIFIAFRVVGGVAIGFASVIAPAYIAEIAPAHMRGRLGSLQQLAIVTGIFLSQLVNKLFTDASGGASQEFWMGLETWRWMLLVCIVPALGYLVGAFSIPESPRFLVSTGRDETAKAVLGRILNPESVNDVFDRIKYSIHTEVKPSIKDIRGRAAGLKPIVWVGIGLAIFQQFVGINVVFYYSNTLWQSVGFTESQSLLLSLISATINVIVTIVAILLVDNWGRRPLLLTGSVGMALSLGTMAVVFQMAPVGANGPILEGASGPIALVCANLFVVFFGMSWGPIMWVMLGEMFPNKIRGAALAVAGFAQWIANFVVTQTFPIFANISLGLAYGLYATFAVLSLFFVLKWVPETKGLELEDMKEE